MPIIGISWMGKSANKPYSPTRSRHTDFAAEFILLMNFTLTNAGDFWGMNTVDFIIVFSFLLMDLLANC